MTFTLDKQTLEKLHSALFGEEKNLKLTNIVFHVERGHIEAWFHFREKQSNGTYSAPSYDVYTVTMKSDFPNPSCSEAGA